MFIEELERAAGLELSEELPEPSADHFWELTLEAATEPRGAESGVLPFGLDAWLPGPYLAAVVSALSARELSGHDRIILLKAEQRLVAHFQARSYQTMASVHEVMTDLEDGDAEFGFRMASAEIRAALHQTARAANAELNTALDLTDSYPQVHQALLAGRLDRRRAGLIIHRTSHLEPETARQVVSQLIGEGAAEMTSGEIISRLDQLNIGLDPQAAEKRQKQGLEERRVYPEQNWDGTSHYLGLHLPPEQVAAAHRRINQIAHTLKTGSEPRSMDQLRADIYLDLLTGNQTPKKTHRSAPASVDIRVPVTTLTGETETPGEIPGWGPVLADAARQIVADNQNGHWKITVVDPKTGQPLAAVSTKRRPNNHQTRQVQAKHQVCSFPGCRNPAETCDLDHNIPWAQGGPTAVDKLAPLCPGDHTIRHHGWTYQINPDSTITWTSPLGHKYTKRPWRPP